ncbi:Hypothetical predicted protein, partial [Pelobates cultripes]
MLASGILMHSEQGIIQWVDMERAQLDKNATLDFLWTPRKHRPNKPNLYPTTALTVHIWSKFLDTVGAKETFHPNAPLTALRAISPDIRLQTWVHAGIRHIHQLMQSQEVMTFTDIQQKWELPANAIFTYLQLKGIINTHVNRQQQPLSPSPPSTKAIIERCWKGPMKKKSISLCYKAWDGTLPNTTPHCKTMWETECTIQLTDDEWIHALNAISNWTKCYTHIEAHRKLLYRWHLTPYTFHKIYPNSSPLCWRCLAEIGTHKHIWWSCPNIQPLWVEVQNTLSALN